MTERREKPRVVSLVNAGQARHPLASPLAFSVERFIHGLPHTRPEGKEYERWDGGIRFLLTSPPKWGIPHGQDRLLTIWLAAAYEGCGRPASGAFQLDSLDAIPAAFGLPPRNSKHTALARGLRRLFHATLFVYDERPGVGKKAERARLNIRRFNLLEAMDLWIGVGELRTHGPPRPSQLTLSHEFAEALRREVMPVDLHTVGALKDSASALDLYCWQAHRSWELQRQKHPSLPVPVFGPEGLLAQLGGRVDDEEEAQRQLRANQELVQGAWTGCPNHFTEDGRFLVLGPCKAVGTARPPLPSVSTPSSTRHLSVVRPPRASW